VPALLLGYADRLSAPPGESLAFKLSADPEPYQVDLVRLGAVEMDDSAHGRVRPDPVPGWKTTTHLGRRQTIHAGSYGVVRLPRPLPVAAFSLDLWCLPTLRDQESQTLAASHPVDGGLGWRLALAGDTLMLQVVLPDGRSAQSDCRIGAASRQWLHVAGGYDPTGTVWVAVRGQARWDRDRIDAHAAAGAPTADRPLLLGGVLFAAEWSRGGPAPSYHGRLERPRLGEYVPDRAPSAGAVLDQLDDAPPLAQWDFSVEMHSDRIHDVGPQGLHGVLANLPTRAVTGHAWTGESLRFTDAPHEWAAIHFHPDDLADAGWDDDFTITLPPTLPSGVYAARVTQGQATLDLPFYVTARRGTESPVLFLAPTNTYLAYANEHLAHGERGRAHESMMAGPIELAPEDVFLREHPELGLSLYDTHADGSGTVYSSRLRPILNLRPDYVTWLTAGRRHLAADFYLTGWLERLGVDHDVATDEDLDRLGEELLARYRVVVTGTHPEYITAREYDALSAYAAAGGRIMYLGANGFFWVTSFTDESRTAVECRRGFAAQRNWTSHPAETLHSSTGEQGGAWLHRARSSRELFGVGMCAAGWGAASGYERTETSRDPEVAFAFEGVADERLGDEGLVLGGAAGDELDSADVRHGTPLHTKVLLTSRHGPKYLPTLEAVQSLEPDCDGTHNGEVRSDVVLLETARGGMVFSVGSICWAGAMAVKDYDNDVARLTSNVLLEFLRPADRHEP
jgi:N,N-dimethylformamidase